jgi:hypothetical protein
VSAQDGVIAGDGDAAIEASFRRCIRSVFSGGLSRVSLRSPLPEPFTAFHSA